MPILFGIDGTGDQNDADYYAHMSHSFVRLICPDEKSYRRGPGMLGDGPTERHLGNDVWRSIELGAAFIQAERESHPSEPVLLTGYSRGAAGVVRLASKLQDSDIPVRALMLFDCVNMDLTFNSMNIPNNVEIVRHVRRSASAHSRGSFMPSGLLSVPPTMYLPMEFYHCTHGGMGGAWWTPPKRAESFGELLAASAKRTVGAAVRPVAAVENAWQRRSLDDVIFESLPDGMTNVTYRQDIAGSLDVWNAVQPFLIEEGFVSKAESASLTARLLLAASQDRSRS